MDASKVKRDARQRRHERIRKSVMGTAERPRLAVFRSNKGIYAQLIDDTKGHTLVAASSLEKDVSGDDKTGVANAVGKLIAERAQAAGVSAVVFDRGGNRYQGRVKALAEGAREGGLQF